jgi:hypothetical protein
MAGLVPGIEVKLIKGTAAGGSPDQRGNDHGGNQGQR